MLGFADMPRDAAVGGVAVLIVIGALGWYVAIQPERPTPSAIAELTEESEYYSISAAYPAITPLRESAGAYANDTAVARLKADIEDGARTFKQGTDPSQLSSEVKTQMGLGAGRKFTLAITYEATSSPHTLSYIFTAYEDTLGAHPNGNFLTETFDSKTGAHRTLKDMFVSGADYLTVLSVKSRAVLIPHIAEISGVSVTAVDTTYLKAGTEPHDANFQNFYLADSMFVVLFPPYQVGPYVIGPQMVSIPVSELQDILKSEYR